MKPGQFRALVEKVHGDWDFPVPEATVTHVGGNVKSTCYNLFDRNEITVKIENRAGETKLTIKSKSNFYHPEHEWQVKDLIDLADALDTGREILVKANKIGE